jgi:hypothetical protein
MKLVETAAWELRGLDARTRQLNSLLLGVAAESQRFALPGIKLSWVLP